jgi:hypothetical protein
MNFEDLRRKHARKTLTVEETVAAAVREQLRGSDCPPRKIAQAEARATRAIKVPSCTPERAILRAVAWARCADETITQPRAALQEGASCSN